MTHRTNTLRATIGSAYRVYEKFFGLNERPFQMAPNPHYLFLAADHQAALVQLEYAITNDEAFCLITGEIGSGKTTLIRHTLDRLESTVTVGLVSNTSPHIDQLISWVSLAFDLPFDGLSHLSLQKQFENFLIREYAARRKVVLIVDEAQNLGRRNLEDLRLLSNINGDREVLLQVILVGQPELRRQLQSPRLAQFEQRISVRHHMGPLTANETSCYVQHRLKIAGGDPLVFSREAIRLVYLHSRGVPRLINRLCDRALVHAFGAQEQSVGYRTMLGVISATQTRRPTPVPGNKPSDSSLLEP